MSSYFQLKESENLELKKSTAQLKPAVISIAAMLRNGSKITPSFHFGNGSIIPFPQIDIKEYIGNINT